MASWLMVSGLVENRLLGLGSVVGWLALTSSASWWVGGQWVGGEPVGEWVYL